MIKAIFFDIDGTLLSSKGKALKSTEKAIAAIHKQGILVGVATGRSPYRLQQHLKTLNLDLYVTYNGQLVYSDKRTLYQQAFSPEEVKTLLSFGEKNRRQMLFGSRYQLLGSGFLRFSQGKTAQKFYRFLPRWFPVVALKKSITFFKRWMPPTHYPKEKILTTPIYQCVMLSPMGELAALKKQFPQFHFTRSNKFTVDILPKGASKIVGIEQVVTPFEISLKEVMVFGDSFNDLEMLEKAGLGIAMGNAPKEVKKRADYVTTSNNEAGILQALQHFKIIS